MDEPLLIQVTPAVLIRATPAMIIATLALLVSMVSLGFTWWKGRRDLARQESLDYLNAATRRLEVAFDVLDKSRRAGLWNNLPEPSRLNWLSAARMIRESQSTAAGITERSHKVLYEHAVTYWRGRMYDLLAPLSSVSIRYFATDADSIVAVVGSKRLPIAERSLRTILDFIDWPSTKEDPLAGVGGFSDHEIDKIRSFRYRPVADYLEAHKVMSGPEEDRKKYWRQAWEGANPE